MKPLLVGEDNPLSADPRHALSPFPPHHAGGRLCRRIMGISVLEYVRRFDRVNLCTSRWSIKEARKRAAEISETADLRPAVVLLGSKVCDAFAVEYVPFSSKVGVTHGGRWKTRVVVLPHPSGRCRAWNDPASFERARTLLRSLGLLT